MIFQGTFNDITNTHKYYVKIGSSGIIREIQEGNIDQYNDGNILCFSGDSPVTLSSDMSDTFTHVYIRSCTINLMSNYDIRKYVVASNYMDIPVEIRHISLDGQTKGPIIFSGYVNPLSFNQPFAYEWNEFSLECADRLSILEYKKFPELIEGVTSYDTPRRFLTEALEECNFGSNEYPIDWDIDYDCTTTTLINPSIFRGESEDDWMTALDAAEEICKIYGCYIWQDGNVCKVKNMLLEYEDLSNPYNVQPDDYMSDDANISVSEAYNMIKCTVDISALDDTFVDPFDNKYFEATTQRPERIMTEIGVKVNNTYDAYYAFTNLLTLSPYVRDWTSNQNNFKDVNIYDHYAQIYKNDLFNFGNDSYLTNGGTSTTDAVDTLTWLKEHPGKGAFIGTAVTSNIADNSNTDVVSVSDIKPSLFIQIGGHCEKNNNYQAERDRLAAQINANIPVCSFTLPDVVSLTPNDKSTTNYLIINGKVKFNAVRSKAGPQEEGVDNTNDYIRSRKTVDQCITWTSSASGFWDRLNSMVMSQCVVNESDMYYYQNYTWENIPEISAGQINFYPHNQNPVLTQRDMFLPPIKNSQQNFKWEGSSYNKNSGDPSNFDNIARIPVLTCELKIGNKYLTENIDYLKQYSHSQPSALALSMIYSWKTAEEATAAGVNTSFTLFIDPSIGDYIIGKEYDFTNTVGIDMMIKEKGFAIPIPYSAGLMGETTFRILGPVNSEWVEVSSHKHGILWWKSWSTSYTNIPLLSYVENISISNFEIKLASDNGGYTLQNADNDLVYVSDFNQTYDNDKEFDCKFCCGIIPQEVLDLGIDYRPNNSTIYRSNNNEPFLGITYKGVNHVKLEEARVSEQYNIWKRPRNIIEVSLKIKDAEQSNYLQNFTFRYLPNDIYKTISREIDLKQDIMTCTMKDFQDNKNT